jgi:exosortase/archaeosortase family protein
VVVLRDSRAFSYWLRLNAYLATRLLGGLGMQVSQDGATLRFHGRSLEILGGCDGLEPAGLYALALLLYPAPVRRRLLGLGTGLSLLLLVNLLRIVTLVLLFSWNQRVFNEAHHWGWPVILTVTALLLWFLWTRAPRHDP